MTVSRPLVVVPTFNEAENIVELLDQVLVAAPEVDVLVVDDSSPDHTGDLVSSHPGFGSRVHLLTRPGKAGLGVAYRAGFTWALDRDYDAVVQMDADFSHPPARLPALIGALADHDLVIGSRYVPGGGIENWACRVGSSPASATVCRQGARATGARRHRRVQGVPQDSARQDPRSELTVQRLLLPDREHLAGLT